jgi:anthranilate synthase
LRSGFPLGEFRALQPDLVVLSPGPGTPKDFGVSTTIAAALSVGLPVFGVCLGLQGMVEHFGGELGQLLCPVHGKASNIRVLGGRIFRDFPSEFTAGRYHSLYAVRETLPPDLRVTAESKDGVIMAIEHVELPLAAVQFHPESIMSLKDNIGLRLVRNTVTMLSSV